MKIFLTGGSGMVGRNILEHSSASLYQITLPTSSELNLLDYNSVYDALNEEKPDLIIHAAGRVGGIHANIANPVSFLSENLYMGLNVITASEKIGIPNLINLSSSCMYPRNADNPLREDMILKGELEPTNEGYAIAKIASTRLCEYISYQDPQKKYKTVIPCNLYGRHDKYDPSSSHLIAAIICKLHNAVQNNNETVSIWGDGTVRREFLNALDLADFIFYAINNLDKMPQNLNVGLGHDFSIKEYYQMVASVLNYTGKFEYDLSKPMGVIQKLADDSQLKKFGWKPKIDLTQGITEAYKFYRESFNNGI